MNYETKVVLKVAVWLIPIIAALIRLAVVLPSTNSPVTNETGAFSRLTIDTIKGSHIMIMLGSGGHTGEMMKLMAAVDLSQLKRTWVFSSDDSTSIIKCKTLEDSLSSQYGAKFLTVPRARSVGEPLALSVIHTIISFTHTAISLTKMVPELPDVLVINGPGTCVPIAYTLFALKFLGLGRTKIIYVESLARVRDLSLSGKLVLPVADRIVAQWPQAAAKYKRTEYRGILV